MNPLVVPKEISEIWRFRNEDMIMHYCHSENKKLREKIDKHEAILTEVLFFITHETHVSCASSTCQNKS